MKCKPRPPVGRKPLRAIKWSAVIVPASFILLAGSAIAVDYLNFDFRVGGGTGVVFQGSTSYNPVAVGSYSNNFVTGSGAAYGVTNVQGYSGGSTGSSSGQNVTDTLIAGGAGGTYKFSALNMCWQSNSGTYCGTGSSTAYNIYTATFSNGVYTASGTSAYGASNITITQTGSASNTDLGVQTVPNPEINGGGLKKAALFIGCLSFFLRRKLLPAVA